MLRWMLQAIHHPSILRATFPLHDSRFMCCWLSADC